MKSNVSIGTIKDNEQYKQSNCEAWLTLGVYSFYFIWWYVFAYGLGDKDPSAYSYILGFPSWFFLSCLVGYPVICCVLWFVVQKYFKDDPLLEIETSSQDMDYRADDYALQVKDERHPELL